MVISRFFSLLVFLGTLCGSLSTYTMGGSFRSFAFPKGRLFAAALGGGYFGVQSTMQKYKQQQPKYVPEYTDYNHPFDLNKRGLAHSLPKKVATPVSSLTSVQSLPVSVTSKKTDQTDNDTLSSSAALLVLSSALSGGGSYFGTKQYIFNEYNIQMILKNFPDLIVKETKDITQEEAELRTRNNAIQFLEENPHFIVEPPKKKTNKIAERNAINSGLKTMAKSLLSTGVSKGIAFVADTDTETVDEVGEFVSAEVDKNAIRDEQERKALNMVSAGKLALKLGLVWLAYQGVKKIFTYATGYQCQCPELPTSVVGNGNVAKFAKYCVEGGTRGLVKGLLASTIVMPLLSMAEPKAVPPVSDAEIQKMVNERLTKKHRVPTPAHAG